MSGKERRSSSSGLRPSSSSGRSSRPPPPEDEGQQQQPPPPMENGSGGGAGGDEDGMMAASNKGPMAVGRSLEISATPDVCMEMLVDKLKLLDYEKEFCRRKKSQRKPLNRAFFACQSADNQFFYFTSLVSWLLGLAGVELKEAKEFDDPGTTCANILSALKKLGFASPSYHASKLTPGWGKEVCGILDALVDYVLEKRNYSYRRPVYLPDGYQEDADAEEGEEGDTAADAADEFAKPAYADEETEEAYMELGGGVGGVGPSSAASAAPGDKGGAAAMDAEKAILQSRVDPNLWKLELERVAPKLRILLNADAKDWRSHLEEVHDHSKTISVAWPDSKVVLEKLRGDLNNSLDKLVTRERFLNEQFEHLMQQYRAARGQLGEIQENYNKRTEAISDRNNELHRISEQLEEMKHLMDEKGTNISDATPVVRMKNAIKKLAEELHDMEVRIGVVSHTLLQLSLKNKRQLQAQAGRDSDEEDD